MADNQHRADLIREGAKGLDYEEFALEALARSWELDDPHCQRLALMDASVWATLHLARVSSSPAIELVTIQTSEDKANRIAFENLHGSPINPPG